MKKIFLLLPILLLVACQSCHSAKNPSPIPPVNITEAGSSVSEAGVESVEPGVVDASVHLPDVLAGPCGGLLSIGLPFCAGDDPIYVSLETTPTGAKVKLSSFKVRAGVHLRLAVRHVNGASAKMKVVIVLKNDGPITGTLILSKKGVSGPSTDFQSLESLAYVRWTTSTAKPPVSVPAGKSARFDPSIEVGMPKDFSTMGLYDYSFSQSHTLDVCLLGEREDFSACVDTQ